MLTHWLLENFKPINGQLELPLRPVTVLAGLNSSGKSSILQSILLIAQTLGNQNAEKPLILNGHIVQLGTFDNAKNERTKSQTITIGFNLTLETEEQKQPPVHYRVPRPPRETIKNIKITSQFQSASPTSSDTSAIEAVKVALRESTINITLQKDPGQGLSFDDPIEASSTSISATIKSLSPTASKEYFESIGEEFIKISSIPEDEKHIATINNANENQKQISYLTRLSHFLPERFFEKYSLHEEATADAIAITNVLFGEPPGWWSARLQVTLQRLVTEPLSAFILDSVRELANLKSVPHFSGQTARDLATWAQATPLKTIAKNRFNQRVKTLLTSDLIRSLQSKTSAGTQYGLRRTTNGVAVSALDLATDKVVGFFSTMVRYLGPLRADPRAAQGFAPSNEPDDVGVKGEYAASVYEANRKQSVTWWNPENNKISNSTLELAVDSWARYLGVAHHISTRDAGISGVSWTVQHLPGHKERPLQSVGVGVSQILPILVAGLLAPRGAIILIEQPELHLHARAQARLGDFFVGLSSVGKQCIIETHSENLVTQLRYHIVQHQDLNSTIEIYFISQNESGDANFTPVSISKSGNIENWPDGFFDESLHQEDKITRQALSSRRPRVTK
ncbi:DUF3696 domain-containing protein [Corallococcus exercitus]|uniref:DUF3696 domain-containing protein n=1 Tax=Corallococcus exercitus TaxID=2316736 RepID=A0A7Y4JQ36_9BACT|nr:DUF3696 domain-containing protein [Corallococcus exercitus]NOK08152.1 DUF3696 domain-containing protein [Corallococcus exercitus]